MSSRRSAVAKQIFHQAVIFAALAVVDPKQLAEMEATCCTQAVRCPAPH
jgi:hypothetical protein